MLQAPGSASFKYARYIIVTVSLPDRYELRCDKSDAQSDILGTPKMKRRHSLRITPSKHRNF